MVTTLRMVHYCNDAWMVTMHDVWMVTMLRIRSDHEPIRMVISDHLGGLGEDPGTVTMRPVTTLGRVISDRSPP